MDFCRSWIDNNDSIQLDVVVGFLFLWNIVSVDDDEDEIVFMNNDFILGLDEDELFREF